MNSLSLRLVRKRERRVDIAGRLVWTVVLSVLVFPRRVILGDATFTRFARFGLHSHPNCFLNINFIK